VVTGRFVEIEVPRSPESNRFMNRPYCTQIG
jgi:hypothetical protein